MKKDQLSEGFVTGETCNRDGCKGIIAEHDTDTCCSCHINPPCGHCTEDRNYCPECDWQSKDDYVPSVISAETSEFYKNQMLQWQKQRYDFDKKLYNPELIDKLEMRHESHTHFSQKIIGVYPPGTETKESILPKVRGTFGGRFSKWSNFSFEYIAYTD